MCGLGMQASAGHVGHVDWVPSVGLWDSVHTGWGAVAEAERQWAIAPWTQRNRLGHAHTHTHTQTCTLTNPATPTPPLTHANKTCAHPQTSSGHLPAAWQSQGGRNVGQHHVQHQGVTSMVKQLAQGRGAACAPGLLAVHTVQVDIGGNARRSEHVQPGRGLTCSGCGHEYVDACGGLGLGLRCDGQTWASFA